jgi:hypothetical protein
MKVICIALMALFCATSVQAQAVYKCKDKAGHVVYTTTSCDDPFGVTEPSDAQWAELERRQAEEERAAIAAQRWREVLRCLDYAREQGIPASACTR